MSKGKQLPQQIEAEHIAGLEQKLTDLKTHQEQFDQANYAMHHSKNEAEALEYWHLMNKAEKKYIAVLNQIETCGFIVKWNKERQEYEAYKHHMS